MVKVIRIRGSADEESNVLLYSLLAHGKEWKNARVPQMAWEYNCQPAVFANCAAEPAGSFVETSANVIIEAMRREDNYIELRMIECFGIAGTATLKLRLRHNSAAITDITGGRSGN